MDEVNDKVFKLKLKEPYGLVIDSLGKISSNVPFMMPERLAKTDAFEPVPENMVRSFYFDKMLGFLEVRLYTERIRIMFLGLNQQVMQLEVKEFILTQ